MKNKIITLVALIALALTVAFIANKEDSKILQDTAKTETKKSFSNDNLLNSKSNIDNEEVENKSINSDKNTGDNSLLEVKEGYHYQVLKDPLLLPPTNGAMLTEFFWLGCPHCQNFEPQVIEWKERLNKEMNISVFKIAVPGSGRWNMDAKVFYTLKKLGANESHVTKMLSFYKREGEMYKSYPTEEKIATFFENLGFEKTKAMEIYNNDQLLNSDLAFANKEFLKLNAGGVPAFVVNGKYKIMFENVKTNEDVYQIIRSLSLKK